MRRVKLPRVSGHDRDVVDRRERVPDVAQRLRIVVHDQDASLFLSPHRARTMPHVAGRGPVADLLGHRQREGEPRVLARPATGGPDAVADAHLPVPSRWPGPGWPPTPGVPSPPTTYLRNRCGSRPPKRLDPGP